MPHIMNDQMKALLASLPSCPERIDDVANQVLYLIEIARKLGMSRVADYLFAELNNYHRYHGPKLLHPEQLPGEVHLLNSAPETVRYIGWKSKRAGKVALDLDGVEVPGQVPVFVSAAELEKVGQLTDRDTVAPGLFIPVPDAAPSARAPDGETRKKARQQASEKKDNEPVSLGRGVLPDGFFGKNKKDAL